MWVYLILPFELGLTVEIKTQYFYISVSVATEVACPIWLMSEQLLKIYIIGVQTFA